MTLYNPLQSLAIPHSLTSELATRPYYLWAEDECFKAEVFDLLLGQGSAFTLLYREWPLSSFDVNEEDV